MQVDFLSDGGCEPFGVGGHTGSGWAIGETIDAECIQEPLIPDFGSKPYEIYCGDARETIRRLTAGGIQFDCLVTSPPYFNQRLYGDDPREIGRESGRGGVDSFISTLVGIFREIPLRAWASIWVNIGDKRGSRKELRGVPERFVVAMQDAGFFLVDKVVWVKELAMVDGTSIGRCMVEPANGRLNGNGWEPFYRFVRDPDEAWSDTCSVRTPRDDEHFFHENTKMPVEQHSYSKAMKCVTSLEGRNIPNSWYIGNSRHGKGHFAAYPNELVERPIAMTCPEHLVDDGGEIKPRVRIVQPTVYSEGPGRGSRNIGQYSLTESQDEGELAPEEKERRGEGLRERAGRMDFARRYIPKYPKTLGWTHDDKPVVGPGIVFDPFGGNGTTGEVAVLLGRRFVGIDLYQANAERMKERCETAFERLKIERRVN
jgi:site-specific DNA-methyltransferase (adenine-specific)